MCLGLIHLPVIFVQTPVYSCAQKSREELLVNLKPFLGNIPLYCRLYLIPYLFQQDVLGVLLIEAESNLPHSFLHLFN